MLTRSKILIFLVFLFGTVCSCTIIGVGAELLQGNVNISRKLPPIPHELRTGVIFNEANLVPVDAPAQISKTQANTY